MAKVNRKAMFFESAVQSCIKIEPWMKGDHDI